MSTAAAERTPTSAMAQRASGLVVPAHLAHLAEKTADDAPHDGIARDPDGRRRVLLSRNGRRGMMAAANEFGEMGIMIALHCATNKPVRRLVKDATTGGTVMVTMLEPVPGACGEIMLREDGDGIDPGFGCKCTRLHFVAGV